MGGSASVKEMSADEYIETMRSRLVTAFDFNPAPEGLPLPFKVWAEFNRRSEKYFMAKKVSLYTIENDEYVGIVDCGNQLTCEMLEKYVADCKKFIASMKPGEDHMNSTFTIAFLSERRVSEDLVRLVETTKYHKDFMFTLRGWADLAVILVDLDQKELYSNRMGKKFLKFYKFE